MERRGTAALGKLLHAYVQGGRKGLYAGVRRRRVGGPAVVVARRQQRFGQVAVFVQPVRPVQGVTGRALIAAVIHNELAVGRCRAGHAATLGQGRVMVAQGLEHVPEAPAVEDQVMRLGHQPVVVGAQADQAEPPQGATLQHVRLAHLRTDHRQCRGRRLGVAAQVMYRQRHRQLGGEGLQR